MKIICKENVGVIRTRVFWVSDQLKIGKIKYEGRNSESLDLGGSI